MCHKCACSKCFNIQQDNYSNNDGHECDARLIHLNEFKCVLYRTCFAS